MLLWDGTTYAPTPVDAQPYVWQVPLSEGDR